MGALGILGGLGSIVGFVLGIALLIVGQIVEYMTKSSTGS